jgi:hypothetical protein
MSVKRCRRYVSLVVALICLVLGGVYAKPAFAVEAGQIVYVSGTLAVPSGTVGSFDTSSPTALMFKFGAPGASSGETAIEYKNIVAFDYNSELARHLGVLPAIAVGLVRKRERRHFFSFKFTDSSNVTQAVIFEVPKSDPPGLLAILNARAPQSCRSPRLQCLVPPSSQRPVGVTNPTR